jgi:hypothetical protein
MQLRFPLFIINRLLRQGERGLQTGKIDGGRSSETRGALPFKSLVTNLGNDGPNQILRLRSGNGPLSIHSTMQDDVKRVLDLATDTTTPPPELDTEVVCMWDDACDGIRSYSTLRNSELFDVAEFGALRRCGWEAGMLRIRSAFEQRREWRRFRQGVHGSMPLSSFTEGVVCL